MSPQQIRQPVTSRSHQEYSAVTGVTNSGPEWQCCERELVRQRYEKTLNNPQDKFEHIQIQIPCQSTPEMSINAQEFQAKQGRRIELLPTLSKGKGNATWHSDDDEDGLDKGATYVKPWSNGTW